MTRETQCSKILRLLEHGRTLTQLSALNIVGTLRLGARIFDLRQRGHKIKSTRITLSGGQRVAQYSMAR